MAKGIMRIAALIGAVSYMPQTESMRVHKEREETQRSAPRRKKYYRSFQPENFYRDARPNPARVRDNPSPEIVQSLVSYAAFTAGITHNRRSLRAFVMMPFVMIRAGQEVSRARARAIADYAWSHRA